MKAASPYLTAAEAAEYLRFPTLAAFRTFLWRCRKDGHSVPTYRRRGTLLFKQTDLDATLDVEKPRFRAVRKASGF